MKKYSPCIIVLLFVFSVLASCEFELTDSERVLIYEIVNWLKNENFAYARQQGNTLELRDASNKHFDDLVIPENIFKTKYFNKVLYIKKHDQWIYFILSSSSGDESGIIYTPTWNIDMNGIKYLQRINGQLYYFQSW
jgi:hypothetical protein